MPSLSILRNLILCKTAHVGIVRGEDHALNAFTLGVLATPMRVCLCVWQESRKEGVKITGFEFLQGSFSGGIYNFNEFFLRGKSVTGQTITKSATYGNL